MRMVNEDSNVGMRSIWWHIFVILSEISYTMYEVYLFNLLWMKGLDEILAYFDTGDVVNNIISHDDDGIKKCW